MSMGPSAAQEAMTSHWWRGRSPHGLTVVAAVISLFVNLAKETSVLVPSWKTILEIMKLVLDLRIFVLMQQLNGTPDMAVDGGS
jgi:hypothetical protein